MFIIRVALGLIFAFSGFSKVTHPAQNFTAVIESYQIVKGPAAMYLALGLPWIELVVGLFLALGLWTRSSLKAALAMNLVFIAVLAQAIARKLPINDCGCFGGAFSLKPWQTLLVDFGLLAFLAWMLRFPESADKFSLDRKFK